MAASAAVTQGNSYGFGFKLDAGVTNGSSLTLLALGSTGLINATADTSRLPPNASGNAPGIYDTTLLSTVKVFADGNMSSVGGLNLGPLGLGNSTASATAGLVGLGGVFSGRADSDVDGLAGSRTAHGFGSVQGLSLDIASFSLNFKTDPLVALRWRLRRCCALRKAEKPRSRPIRRSRVTWGASCERAAPSSPTLG